MKRALAAVLLAGSALAASKARATTSAFSFDPPGTLEPSSGKGRADSTIYAPGMRFPIESGPAYANSQVYNPGGSESPGGVDQCDGTNYTYPWRDNYCEARSWSMPLCPSGTGHQGQDLRPATCKKDVHWVVAVTAGTITNVGSYSVYLTAADGTRYDYLHMGSLQVKPGDVVKKGQRIGRVSNVFGSTATTIHLHFNVRKNVRGVGEVFVPPYASLVRAYQEMLGLVAPAPEGEISSGRALPAPADLPAPTTEDPPADDATTAEVDVEADASAGCQTSAPRPASGAVVAGLGLALAIAARRVRRKRA